MKTFAALAMVALLAACADTPPPAPAPLTKEQCMEMKKNKTAMTDAQKAECAKFFKKKRKAVK